MAFEATHVRFARDLASVLKVLDLPAYFAGCVYPDSRYITGLTRERTHGLRCITSQSTDFEKGWFTHLLYDELVGPCYLQTSVYAGQTFSTGSEAWIYMTAAKLIEDWQAYPLVPSAEAFASMGPPTPAPNGEDAEKLGKYYRLLSDLYQKKPSLDEYGQLFSEFHLPTPVSNMVTQRAQEFLANELKCNEIAGFYQIALSRGVQRTEATVPQTYSE